MPMDKHGGGWGQGGGDAKMAGPDMHGKEMMAGPDMHGKEKMAGPDMHGKVRLLPSSLPSTTPV